MTQLFRRLKAVGLTSSHIQLKLTDSNSLEQKKYAEIGLANGPRAQRGTNLISATVVFTSKEVQAENCNLIHSGKLQN